MAAHSALAARVKEILKTSAKEGKLIAFNDIERKTGESISSWKAILDRISQECRSGGHPDLTAIVIYKATGYPAFFNDFWVGRSKPFDPNKPQVGRTLP